MGMRVTVSINNSLIGVLELQRTNLGDPAPGVGTGDYQALLYTFKDEPEKWAVLGHDRSTGAWGLIRDALEQRP